MSGLKDRKRDNGLKLPDIDPEDALAAFMKVDPKKVEAERRERKRRDEEEADEEGPG